MNLLKQYINKITINNINDFATKNNIILNEKELKFIFDLVKNNYEKIINDLEPFKDKLKQNLTDENYHKIINLYNTYKEKYQNYLI